MTKRTNTNTAANNTNATHNNIPMSEVIRRKSRMIGTDDLQTAANICRWAEQGGLRGPALQVAESLATAFDSTLHLSTRSQHREAAKKASSILYVLKRNEKVQNLTVDCRDGRKRKLKDVVAWFADRHFRIADDIEAALDAEAEVAAKAAELRAVAKKASESAIRVATKLTKVA